MVTNYIMENKTEAMIGWAEGWITASLIRFKPSTPSNVQYVPRASHQSLKTVKAKLSELFKEEEKTQQNKRNGLI